jgi:DNA-binding response OmpR family regulator/predicted regulator of Ras-like GTPase activity (Roadblock/LC7/MglB family)
MYNILIVDEEEHLLWALEKNLFPDREDINVVTANSGEQGLEALQAGDVDLLVSDIKMPGRVDGFQLILRAKEISPESRVIIMTAFGTARIQNFADRIGITHYIEKPFNISELRDAILELLDEKQGFQGVLSDLELTDIIQMLCLAKRTALLHLKYRDHRGKIVFEKGDILHSEFDDVVGDEAVFEMLALKQGDIFMQSDFQVDQRTVTMSWQDLLFEGIKRADESHLGPDDDGTDDNTDTGMGISSEVVDKIVGGGTSDLSQETSFPFFSEEELAEIETGATLDSHEGSVVASKPFDAGASLMADEQSEASFASTTRISSPHHQGPTVFAETEESDAEFRTPFRPHPHAEVRMAPMAAQTNVPTSVTYTAIFEAADVPSQVSAQPSPPPALDSPPLPSPSEESSLAPLVHKLSPDAFQWSLEDFARDCPGLVITGILSPTEAIALNSVAVQRSNWDADAIAVFFADVVAAAQRTVKVLSAQDEFNELQLALQDQFALFRRLEGTQYVHVAIVERATSLGVALVMMRRFQKTLRKNLEGT